ncbi:hypothetical protein DUI87_19771 [Hirundo rustica rustica]|uniref:MHC class I-like antigen recognition-like domain-containing protein n=1 Tax=Hirundo rustica rustica TaxID=333673 RepID=A0A3M0JRI4_HIRRU|nr:hypothetical protein DUI87_19771 [Hirundo rustica rustica]
MDPRIAGLPPLRAEASGLQAESPHAAGGFRLSPPVPGERPRIHWLGSDRREFLSFQLGSKRFVVATSAGQITKRRWEHEEMEAEE